MSNASIYSQLGIKPVKCSKKDPSTCRIHGKKYTAKEKLVKDFLRKKARQEKEAQQTRELALKIQIDLEKNLKLKTRPDGTTTCSVYRSGSPAPPLKRGKEEGSYLDCDKYVPEGRQPRMNAVFASPTIGGVNRWVLGRNLTKEADLKVREITIDIDKTYVYSVNAWELASSKMDYNQDPAIRKAYWDTGITMREWLERVKEDPNTYNPTEWELLIPPDKVGNPKPVSAQRVVAHNYSKWESDKREVLDALK